MSKQAGRSRSKRRVSPSRSAAVQYTVRGVPAQVDRALRRKAKARRESLNAFLRDTLIREAEGSEPTERLYTDLDDLAGSWVEVAGFDQALEEQDRIDESLWR